jgi:hypothetical protein
MIFSPRDIVEWPLNWTLRTQPSGHMKFEFRIGIGKNLKNGIYEFWEWIGVEKICTKWNSWILKVASHSQK